MGMTTDELSKMSEWELTSRARRCLRGVYSGEFWSPIHKAGDAIALAQNVCKRCNLDWCLIEHVEDGGVLAVINHPDDSKPLEYSHKDPSPCRALTIAAIVAAESLK